jgi:hypothetical protein
MDGRRVDGLCSGVLFVGGKLMAKRARTSHVNEPSISATIERASSTKSMRSRASDRPTAVSTAKRRRFFLRASRTDDTRARRLSKRDMFHWP